ncbi:MAG: preprotein translocase subunit SecG, partial [Clostridiales bacterium]|nr:preprotein translocase subunit SecG [Clostridiales bacterium]
MKTVLMIVLALASIVLIASILLQSGKSAGLAGSIGGGAEQLFGKKKGRGYEAILSKIPEISLNSDQINSVYNIINFSV